MNLLTRYRLWRCQRDGFQEITPLNNVAEWDGASADTLLFHWFLKRPLRFAAKSIAVPRHWLDTLGGNTKVLHEVIAETYLQNEKQEGRRSLLQPIIEYGLCLCAFDNNYTEILDSVLQGIVRNRDRFAFDPHRCNPDNWYQDGRGRIEVEQSPDPFKVVGITDSEIYVDRNLASRIITVTKADGKPDYLALDMEHGIELAPTLYVYPIAAHGPSVLDVAPALLAQEVPA